MESFFKFAKKKASGKRIRFTSGDYDLDLSYVTPKIIATSFPVGPSEVIKGLYRNSAVELYNLMIIHHKSNLHFVNVSHNFHSKEVK